MPHLKLGGVLATTRSFDLLDTHWLLEKQKTVYIRRCICGYVGRKQITIRSVISEGVTRGVSCSTTFLQTGRTCKQATPARSVFEEPSSCQHRILLSHQQVRSARARFQLSRSRVRTVRVLGVNLVFQWCLREFWLRLVVILKWMMRVGARGDMLIFWLIRFGDDLYRDYDLPKVSELSLLTWRGSREVFRKYLRKTLVQNWWVCDYRLVQVLALQPL